MYFIKTKCKISFFFLNFSGEYGFRSCAKFFGFAKNPMIKRVDKISSQIPIWFIYGSRSWIDCTPGYTTVYLRQSHNQSADVSVEVYFTNY